MDHWKSKRVPEKHLLLLIDYAKAFDCVDHNKLWKISKEMGLPDHLTCLLRNLYAGKEATVRTGHGATDWFQIRKGVRQGYTLSPCLLICKGDHAKYWAAWSTSWMFLTRSLTGALHFITRMNSDLYKIYVKSMICSEISQLLSFFIPVNKVSLNFKKKKKDCWEKYQ